MMKMAFTSKSAKCRAEMVFIDNMELPWLGRTA